MNRPSRYDFYNHNIIRPVVIYNKLEGLERWVVSKFFFFFYKQCDDIFIIFYLNFIAKKLDDVNEANATVVHRSED